MVILLFVLLFSHLIVHGSEDGRRLFEDLMLGYNKLIRPVKNNSLLINVKFKIRLSQLLDVHEKNQIMTTNVWLEHEWFDHKLTWSPAKYGQVDVLYVPANMIWLPDIVLYNNADGNYEVTIMTKATIRHDGRVNWNPPSIYKSMCHINVQWFPFDEQTCKLKFGSWTYDGRQLDLLHKIDGEESDRTAVVAFTRRNASVECVENGIDLSDYYRSTEWDIIAVPGWKKKETYPCCPKPYIDITYLLVLRRKTLFYSVNLILPCVGISLLTVLVFHLPSDSGEKVTLAMSILISLTVFFLLLVEIIPSTSLVVPLVGKYLVFTMVMVSCSITVTVVVINHHFRSSRTHSMSAWTRVWFLDRLPRLLLMSTRTIAVAEGSGGCAADRMSRDSVALSSNGGRHQQPSWRRRLSKLSSISPTSTLPADSIAENNWLFDFEGNLSKIEQEHRSGQTEKKRPTTLPFDQPMMTGIAYYSAAATVSSKVCGRLTPVDEGKPCCVERQQQHHHESSNNNNVVRSTRGVFFNGDVQRALKNLNFVSSHFKKQEEEEQVAEEWKFVAMVIDRIFLCLFILACAVGTTTIILSAPSLYDQRKAIDEGDQYRIHEENGFSYCHARGFI